jgi:hypothetical protein
VQDLIYETTVITRLSGPISGVRLVVSFVGRLVRLVLRRLHAAWVQKILVPVYPDAATRVWAGDFSKKDLRLLETSGHTTVRRRIRSLRKRNLGDQTGDVLAFDVPKATPGRTAGLFVRLHPQVSLVFLTIDMFAAEQKIASETCTIDLLPTFSFIPLPSPSRSVGRRGKLRATLTLNRGNDALPEDLTFVVDLTRGKSPIVVERTEEF